MPSGIVEFTGTDTSTPPFAGTAAANLRDGDFTTIWAHEAADDGWIGIDLGAAAVVTRLRVASRISTGNNTPGDKAIHGAVLKSSSTGFPTFTSDATVLTVGAIDDVFYPSRMLTPITVPASTARRHWRLAGAAGSYGPQMAEFYFDGEFATGVSSRPVPPTISPWGGGYSGGNASVTLACLTTSASIYYTIDGSTPDNTDTLYTGPISLNFASGDVTLKAIAYDSGQTTTYSSVATATFSRTIFSPRPTWYDDRGILVDAHGGGILDNRARDGFFYLVGAFTNRENNGLDIDKSLGVWMYKSTDLRNWTHVGYILPTPGTFNYCERPKLAYCPSTGNYVIFAHGRSGAGASRICIAESTAVDSGWDWDSIDIQPNGVESRDFNICEHNGKLWFVSAVNGNTSVQLFRMADDYLGPHATPEYTTIITGDREAPVLFHWNGRWYLITSSSNYYDATATFNVSFITSTAAEPTSGFPAIADLTAYAAAKTDLFAADPVGTDFNAQPAFVLKQGNAVLYFADHWRPDALYDSRINVHQLTQPTSSTIRAGIPTTYNPGLTTGRIIGGGRVGTGTIFGTSGRLA